MVSGPYLLEQMGDGYNMFKSGEAAKFVTDDYVSLLDYIQSFPVDEETKLATVPAGAGYDEFAHTGRINYINRPADLDENAWWYDVAIEVLDTKAMNGTENGFDALAEVTTATVFQTLYNVQGKPEAEGTLADVWYADAANWALANKLVEEFAEDGTATRGDVKDILDAYCAMLEVTPEEPLMKGNENGDMMLDKTLTRAEFAQILVNLAKVPMPVAE